MSPNNYIDTNNFKIFILNNEKDYTYPLHHAPFIQFCEKRRIKLKKWFFARETAETRAHNFVFPEEYTNILDFVLEIEAKEAEERENSWQMRLQRFLGLGKK